MSDIKRYIQNALVKKGIEIHIKLNNNTLKSEIYCSHDVNFEPKGSIVHLLGFSPRRLEAKQAYESNQPVSIIKVNSLSIECSITTGAYINGRIVHGRIVRTDGAPASNTVLVSNAMCHLFEEARYEINAIEIDRNKIVGLTSLMKNYVSLNPGQSRYKQNTGWLEVNDNNQSLTIDTGYFDVVIPLSMIFGFAEDYHKIIVNAKHERILTRSKSDANAILQAAPTEQYKIEINKIEWLLPIVTLSDSRKFQLLKYIEKDPPIPISFLTWELYE